MQAIATKYLGPTNFRGARVVAVCDARRIVLEWDHALNPDGNHDAAALALLQACGWSGEWIGGTLAQRIPGWARVYVCRPGSKGKARVRQ